MRTFARIGIGIAIILVLVVVGAIVAIKTIDPNTLIAPVQAQVKAATGRDLTVRGGARIALSLHPRIVLTDVVLSNAPWGTAKELARIERLELAVALMPLLSRRFELEEIVLVKPVVALETDGAGQKNWQASTATSATTSQASGGGNVAAAVAIGDVTISQGIFTYQDGPKAAVSRLVVDKLELRSHALRRSSTVEVSAGHSATRYWTSKALSARSRRCCAQRAVSDRAQRPGGRPDIHDIDQHQGRACALHLRRFEARAGGKRHRRIACGRHRRPASQGRVRSSRAPALALRTLPIACDPDGAATRETGAVRT